MKKVGDANSQLRIELQNTKFDLGLAKEATREKQIKIDFMDKEIEALESKSISRSRAMREKVDLQLNDKNSEIETIRRTFASLETQYKAQKKEIADKDDFISKYMTGRMGEDAEAMQLLIDKYNFYSRQQFENEASRDK